MLLAAFGFALRKFFWIPLLTIVSGLLTFVARHGASDVVGMAEVSVLCALPAIVGLSLVAVPVEYHRLKRQAAGFAVTPQ